MASEAWLASSLPGHCGETQENVRGDCSNGDRGSLGRLPAATNWTAAVEYCLQRCAACERCNHISVSLRWRDCAWYHSCAHRSRDVFCFRSGRASPPDKLQTPLQEPRSTRAWTSQAAASVVILQASDRPEPPRLLDALQYEAHGWHPRPGVQGGIRALTAAINRAYAASHGYDYIYARIVGGCGRGLAAWCQVPAALGLLHERAPAGRGRESMADLPLSPRQIHRYDWVLALDEDVAFNSAVSYAAFLELTRARDAPAHAPPPRNARQGCHDVC